MSGIFIEGTSKILSGIYTLIKSAVKQITMGTRGLIAYPFTSDWGPVNVLSNGNTEGEFKALYHGDQTTLTAAKIYKHAFKGNPQKVMGYRMATSAASKGTVVLNDAGAAKSLELETLYPSDRAFNAIVKDGTSGGKIVQILEGAVKLLEVEGASVAELKAGINASDYIRVKSSGTNLPVNTANAAFTGGNNGNIVTAAEYAAFLDVMEADRRANAFSLDAAEDDALIATVEAWVRRVRREGFYITFVCGGPAAWDTDGGTAANAKSIAANYRGIINVGNGCDGYSAAEMAIFIAARVGSIALNRTLTDEPVPYTSVNKKLKIGQRETYKQKGTLVFVQEGDFVLIDEGVNTLTAPVDDETAEYGKIRVNNALDYIAKDLEAFGSEYKRTRSNTQEARLTYAATIEQDYLASLQRMEIIQPGFYYTPDPDYHGKDAVYTAKMDEAFFAADITPVDSMERLYQKINVNFN